MIVHVITLFPERIDIYLSSGVPGKAREKGLLDVRLIQLRDFADDRHRTVDDSPYGGGAGMILKPDVLSKAVGFAKNSCVTEPYDVPVVLTTPQGRLFTAVAAREYSLKPEWIVICGNYGGVDQRVSEYWKADEISCGDFVLTGGELPALMMIDAAIRFIPGVLGNSDSSEKDAFEDGLLSAPLYTRPSDFEGLKAPEILLSGNHAEVDGWRRQKQLEITLRRRPELIEKIDLTKDDLKFLDKFKDNDVSR